MKLFEPHVHMTSRTTDDYGAMRDAGIAVIVEPSFWVGQPRSCTGSFVDYFNSLIGWERHRAAQFGISHHCTISLNPKEANDDRFRDEVLELLPRYLDKDRVVAVGEIGYDSITPAEDTAMSIQLQLAKDHELPALIHTPHRDKLRGTERTIAVVREAEFTNDRVLIDHNNELTVPVLIDTGVWMGFSVYPMTKMAVDRMVRILQQYGTDRMIVNSAADWGVSDPLNVPKVAKAMSEAGFSRDEIEKVVWRNPIEFFGAGGRLELDPPSSDDQQVYQGNGIGRGEPAVD